MRLRGYEAVVPSVLYVLSVPLGRILFLAIAAALAGCEPSLHDVVGHADLEKATVMLDRNPVLVNARNDLGKTPLHYAVVYGEPQFIGLLAERGADINAADGTGLTPLHVAAMMDRTDEAERLIALKCNIEARDRFGDTPLQLAAVHGCLRTIRLLAQAGADIATTNNQGLGPLESARQNRRDAVVKYLEAQKNYDD